jgi:hypothetical protein
VKDRIHNFLNRQITKALSLGALTLIIGGICSAMGQWDFASDRFLQYKIIALIVIGGLYIVLVAYYSKNEINDRKIASIYEQQNAAFGEVLSGLMSVCKRSADGANKVINSIIYNKQADLSLWSFDDACDLVCENVYALLCKIGHGRDFEVIYDRLDESIKPEKDIYASSFANKNGNHPTILNKKRSIENDKYHDAGLFKLKQADIEVVIGNEEIDKVFDHVEKDKDRRYKNRKKYNQYIAIPVFCKDEKMIGLFEIVCLNKTSLGDTEEEIREIISKYFMIYTFFMLVLQKLEKALIAQPQEGMDV